MRRILMMAVAAAAGIVSAEDAYLQSDGTQVIDTGYYVNTKTKVEVDFEFTEEGGSSNMAVFGQNQPSGQKGNRLVLYRNGSKELTVGYFNSSWASKSVSWTDIKNSALLTRRTFIFDSTTTNATLLTGGATTKTTTITDGAFSATATQPMSIFGWTTADGGYGLPAKMKLYSFKVYEKDDVSGEFVLVHDYIPAIDETDGKAKLLDRADGKKTFLAAAQGGDFAYGGDIPTLRDDPYIESDGTQAIDTGYKVNAKTRIEVDFRLTKKASSSNMMVFGQYGDNELTLFVRSDGFVIGYDYYNENESKWTWKSDFIKAQDMQRHTFVYDVPTDKFIFDGQETGIAGRTSTRSTATATLAIFDRHRAVANSGGSMWTSNRAKMKLYSFKIYEKDGTSGEYALVRDYRPILDTDGKGKLIDIAQNRNVILDQADDGAAFAFNAAVPRFREEAYLEATGSQVIDTGYLINAKTRVEVDFQMTAKVTGENMVVFGQQVGDGGNQLTFFMRPWDFSIGYGKAADNAWTSEKVCETPDTKRHTFIYDVPTDTAVFDGNETKIGGAAGTAHNTATVTMPIFNRHRATPENGSMWYNQFAKMKLYAFRIYEEGELKHQYLPYKNGDVVGLYDTVTGAVKTDVMRSATPFVYHAGGYNNYEGAAAATMAVLPKAKYGVSEGRPAMITVLAPGAYRYVWKKNGEVVEGADAATLEVAAEEVRGNVTYSVQAFYLVDGVEVAGSTAETTVRQSGLIISVR